MRVQSLVFLCFFLASSFFFLPNDAFGQMTDITAELTWGSEQKAPAGSRLAKIIHSGTWGACLFRYRPGQGFSKDRYWLEYYDSRYAFQARHELAIPNKPRADVEDIVYHNGQLYLLMSRPDATEALSQLVVRPLSPQGQVIKNERLIAELPKEHKYRRRQFDLTYSRDSSHILLYNQLPFQPGGPERFTLRVVDPEFKLLWETDEVLDYPDRGFNINEYQVDPAGNIYLLGSFRQAENNRRLPPSYHLFTYRNGGREIVEYKLNIEGVYLRQLTCRRDGNGELVCAGFYVLPGEKETAGLCQIRINPNTQSVVSSQLVPFADKAGMLSFRTKDLVLRTDGGWVLTAEQMNQYSQNQPTMSGFVPQNIYRHDNILIANVNPDGTFAWLRQVAKYQEDTERAGYYSSFTQGTTPDGFYFLYNEHPRNFSPDRRKVYSFTERESVIALTRINRAGELVTNPLFITEDIGVVALPRRCRQIGSRLMLVYAEQGRNYRLGLLRLE